MIKGYRAYVGAVLIPSKIHLTVDDDVPIIDKRTLCGREMDIDWAEVHEQWDESSSERCQVCQKVIDSKETTS